MICTEVDGDGGGGGDDDDDDVFHLLFCLFVWVFFID